MCPPTLVCLFARTTIAIAFQRVNERIRCSSFWSPGMRTWRSSGIVLMYAVFAENGRNAPDRRALSISCSIRKCARSGPSAASTPSSASSHSRVSCGSISGIRSMVDSIAWSHGSLYSRSEERQRTGDAQSRERRETDPIAAGQRGQQRERGWTDDDAGEGDETRCTGDLAGGPGDRQARDLGQLNTIPADRRASEHAGKRDHDEDR